MTLESVEYMRMCLVLILLNKLFLQLPSKSSWKLSSIYYVSLTIKIYSLIILMKI